MNSVYVYLLLNLMYKLRICMLLDADCVLFQLDTDCVFFHKLNANCIFYLAVMGELTSAYLSLLDPW
jgi:hypothetical protein